jgi:hypothetical protein
VNNKKKIKIQFILFAAFIISILLLSASSQGQKAAWKGKIETENGIKVVKNPMEPVFGEFAFQLQEDLSIGGNPNDDNYYFPKGASLSVDDQGTIYVIDVGNVRIQKYDKTGKYVQSIGRKGQGPGEFQFPGAIRFDGEGNIYLNDMVMRTLKVFGPDGAYKKSVALRVFLQSNFYISKEGIIFGLEVNYMAKDGPRIAVIKVSPDGQTAETIAQFQGELKANQPAYALHQYTSGPVLCGLSPSALCYGFSAEYKIVLADATGKTALIIEKDAKPLPITSDEKEFLLKKGGGVMGGIARAKIEKIEDAAVFPQHRPYFNRILADEVGRIYVARRPSVLDTSKIQEFDVFSKEGISLYRIKLPFMPEVIKGGSVYEIRRDEEGETKIVRHKVKNWAEMKAEY